MSVVLSVFAALFWGVLMLSVLVTIHEGGHYLAARACGVRVTEFFIGMPSRHRLSHKSKRYGTEVGVTPILLGGYTRICGMEGVEGASLSSVLACVQRHGRASAALVAHETGISEEEALDALAQLSDWASLRPYYNPELGEEPGQRDWPEEFETLARDANWLTEYDRGHDFSQPGSTAAGEPRPTADAQGLLERERSHTYLGCGFWRRVAMLVAGPAVNVACAFLIVVVALMAVGVDYVSDVNVVSAVSEGSLAEGAGIEAGDAITSVGGTETATWTDVSAALDSVLAAGEDFEVTFEHDGVEHVATVEMDGPADLFGITATVETYYPTLAEASRAALAYAGQVASYAVQLITPTKTMEVLGQSSSVVGISVMASEAATSGLYDLALLAAAISMSLGFMNLLPIPPLDGGKILIEVVQVVIRRPLSLRAQTIVTYAGLAFFGFVFVYVLHNDIVRFVLPS